MILDHSLAKSEHYDRMLRALRRRPVLVTGGAGFLGSHLVEALLRLEAKVLVLDLEPWAPGGNLAAIRFDKSSYVQGSCADWLTLRALLRRNSIVFHLGDVVGTRIWVSDPIKRADGMPSMEVAERARAAKYPRAILESAVKMASLHS